MDVYSIFEALMIICFGISWPMSLVKSYRSRSTKGKSLLFECFILTGYICGLIGKIMKATSVPAYNIVGDLAFWFMIPNIIMVAADICLYFRNKKIEAQAEAKA
jgi:hypothetical protein